MPAATITRRLPTDATHDEADILAAPFALASASTLPGDDGDDVGLAVGDGVGAGVVTERAS